MAMVGSYIVYRQYPFPTAPLTHTLWRQTSLAPPLTTKFQRPASPARRKPDRYVE